MKTFKTLVVLAILGLAASFPTKSAALPVPLQGPGVCGYWELVAYGGVIPAFVWVSVPCPAQK